MRRITAVLMIIMLSLSLAACGQSGKADKTKAEYYVNGLKEKGLPVGTFVVYNSETDPNKVLGKPNEYISKANFEDTRLEQMKDENGEIIKDELGNIVVYGGTVEVFANEKDVLTRKKFLEGMFEHMGEKVGQYMFISGNAMLRVEFELTPEEAKKYGEAFGEL